ncbi:MAG: Gfo/Idh/MocA family oxidoreductase [Acidobacteriota bacterium]|nr:Gfo/Idh/MocA family oxidoreductase [Acidobacteriota bacterium]
MPAVGIVGAGLMGWAHAIGVKALADAGLVDATVAAVVDTDPDRGAALAAATGAVALHTVADAVDRCQALWVCTPTAFHAAAVEEAVGAGRAVFCEKPLATDLATASSLGAAVAAAGAPAQVGLVLRYSPACLVVRDLVASGRLGPVMTVVLRDDQYFPVQGLYGSSWRGDVRLAGGGCLIEHSIHDVDILRFWLGEVDEVAATTRHVSGRPGVEDVVGARMRFASGATAALVSVWHEVLSRGSNRRVEIFGRDAVAWLDDEFAGPVHVQTTGGTEVLPCAPSAWTAALALGTGGGLGITAYVEEDRAFLDALAASRAPAPSFDDALVAHRVVDAMYRSAAEGGLPVSLDATPGPA